MSVDTRVDFKLGVVQAGQAGLASIQSKAIIERILSLQDGLGVDKADRFYSLKFNIAASGNQDIDLAGVLVDIFGATITFARIKGIVVNADPTNVNNVVVGAAASNPWLGPWGAGTHTTQVRPKGLHFNFCFDATGWPVVAGTGDLLRLANSGAGTAVKGDLVLVGASA